MDKRIAILCEAGEHIGLGHITRCSAIHEYISGLSIECSLFCEWEGKRQAGFNDVQLQWKDNKSIFDLSRAYSTVIVDSYKADFTFYKNISTNFHETIAIDDYKRLSNYKSDLVINPNLHGADEKYDNPSIGGADYIILRSPFRKNRLKKNIASNLNNIAIFVGGSDYRSLVPKFVDYFNNSSFHINILCGSDPYCKQMRKVYSLSNIHFSGYLDAKSVCAVMLDADLAISACGQTMHELASVGCPTIGIIIDRDQEPNAEYYAQEGFIPKALRWNESNLMEEVKFQIDRYNARETRLEQSELGRKLIDGCGLKRVCRAILTL